MGYYLYKAYADTFAGQVSATGLKITNESAGVQGKSTTLQNSNKINDNTKDSDNNDSADTDTDPDKELC